MASFAFYKHLKTFLLKGEIPETYVDRRKVRRSSTNFIIKDDRLFYVGPSRQYMRLVVLSDEERRSVLTECHNNSGTGNHSGVRGTQNRVIAGYYWPTIIQDVKEWVRSCHRCQLNDPIKTVVPVLHSIKVKEPWEVLGLDLIGPLPETAHNMKYILTMTDLYTKWVIAEPMRSKTAAEVSAIITSKLYLFGMVRKIITDQGKEFVCKLNDSIFSMLNIKHAVSSAYHPQTNGQDERTNQNIKRALRKYVNEHHNDWDLHLPAVVYGINTAKQYSTRHSPYFLLFNRHPRLPEVMNACPMGDDFEVADPGDDIDTRVNKMKLLNETVLHNIERAQSMQQKTFQNRKRKFVRVCSIQAGDEVLLSRDPKKRRTGDTFTNQHQGPYTVTSITSKGVATIVKGSTSQRVNVSRLRTYYRLKNGPAESMCLQDHCYSTFKWQIEHPYACLGARWEKDLSPMQDELLKYVLDKNRPSEELIIKHGQICLTREDFWSLGLSQCMESNIGNACLKIVEEAAQRHGQNVHIVDLYAVPTWKDKGVDPVHCLPENVRSKDVVLFPAWSRQEKEADHYLLCVLLLAKREILFLDSLRPDGFGDETYKTIFRHIASFIDQGPWNEKTGKDLECFPLQCTGNSCGIYMLMYALSTCTSCQLTFTEGDVPLIRQWWCIQLMERFSLEGHGQRFAHWTDEASQLLQGMTEPVFRVPKSTTQAPSSGVVVEENTDKVQQPTIARDLYTAWYWVNNHGNSFNGEVIEPAFLHMNSDDQQNALRKAQESEFPEAKDDFVFRFQSQVDMETFLSYCVDEQGLKVNAVCE